MRLEHYPLQKLKQDISRIVERHLDPLQYHVFFFGSRVSGMGDEHSDIDLGITGPSRVAPRNLLAIQEELDALPLLYKIEVVDFAQVPDAFRKVAESHMEPIQIP